MILMRAYVLNKYSTIFILNISFYWRKICNIAIFMYYFFPSEERVYNADIFLYKYSHLNLLPIPNKSPGFHNS